MVGKALKLPEAQSITYWQLQERVVEPESLVWHGDKLRSQLEQVMREHLPSGEPVGIFLSGGLDSSCITALAAKLHNAPIHTYSIHFGAECANELEFSSMVANHCQTNHHILEITLADMWSKLPETMAYLDDPIGDPLTVPNLLVGKLASKDVSITLNGEGGDPCFGGPKNQPMLIDSLYSSVTKGDSLQAYLISFQKCAVDLPQLLKPDILNSIEQPSIFAADLNSEMSYLNRLMALNIKFKGADVSKYPNVGKIVDRWYATVEKAEWQNLEEVRQDYPETEAVENLTVFNIKGNTYRLIVGMDYQSQTVYCKYFRTHAEYDKDDWKNDPHFSTE